MRRFFTRELVVFRHVHFIYISVILCGLADRLPVSDVPYASFPLFIYIDLVK